MIREYEGVLKFLIGQTVWGGSVNQDGELILEFGAPHIVVRQPVVSGKKSSEKVKRMLSRRGLSLRGNWSLMTHDADWQILPGVSQLAAGNEGVDELIRMLNGQIVESVLEADNGELCFGFDLHFEVRLAPPPTEYRDLWSLWSQGSKFIAIGRKSNHVFFADSDAPLE